MSDAIEGADVMLYGVSLRYKESANVRHITMMYRPTHRTVRGERELPVGFLVV